LKRLWSRPRVEDEKWLGVEWEGGMASFGVGTFPAMLTLSLLGNSMSVNIRNKINKAVPIFIVAMALLLILRGLNLGIPYVSPEMSTTKPVCHKCCHK
jgi:sulfite exporter TauE/SafE